MKTPLFTGSSVAIVTPMHADGSVHYAKLTELIELQIAAGTAAITVCGTTGESATLTDHERIAVISHCVRTVNGRIPVIAGTGSNQTAHTLRLSQEAKKAGADGLLLVTPYYNKCSATGLVKHYLTVADSVELPIIVYNVPSRTGVNIQPATYQKLAQHPRIAGIKEANGDISSIVTTASLVGDSLSIYSGNDDQVVSLLALGGKGVISVVSNVAPELVHNCCQAFFDGDTAKACALQLEMLPLEEALFCEVNPIPVKYAMNVLGWNAGECRLPLVEPSDAHKAKIEQALQAAGLIKE